MVGGAGTPASGKGWAGGKVREVFLAHTLPAYLFKLLRQKVN